jgi:hypothetical protein
VIFDSVGLFNFVITKACACWEPEFGVDHLLCRRNKFSKSFLYHCIYFAKIGIQTSHNVPHTSTGFHQYMPRSTMHRMFLDVWTHFGWKLIWPKHVLNWFTFASENILIFSLGFCKHLFFTKSKITCSKVVSHVSNTNPWVSCSCCHWYKCGQLRTQMNFNQNCKKLQINRRFFLVH